VLTQFGVRVAFGRLRRPDAGELLERRGVPEMWRRSVTEAAAVVEHLDRRLAPLERELRPPAHADPRVCLLVTIPGVGELLGLTIAVAIGDIGRFPSARKLVGYSGLTPRIARSGERSRTGKLAKAGSKLLAGRRWRPRSRRGGPPTRGTRSTASRRAAPARATRPTPPSRARC
jgi:transposase